MKNILVLVNPSSGQNRIANLALSITHQSNANLLLCNCAETSANPMLVYHDEDEDDWPFEDDKHANLEILVEKLKKESFNNTAIQPAINYLDIDDANTANIKQLVIENEVSMIIMGIKHPTELYTPEYENPTMQLINNAHCPVLLIPEETQVSSIDSIAYLTDLRYCDLDVVKFLSTFKARIYVTHISSNGIPDMEDNYAQTLLSDEIVAKSNYNKIFLRNLKRKNAKNDLELITTVTKIKLFTIVNKKHQLLERFLSDVSNVQRLYHQLPLLIVPYLDWYTA